MIGVVLSLVPLITFSRSESSLLYRSVQDVGHLPLFAWVTTLLLVVLYRLSGTRIGVQAQYLAALVLALGLGLTTEWIQMIGPRDADAWDLFRNVLGAVCAVAWWPTFDRRFDGTQLRVRRNRFLLRAAVTLVFLVTAVPLAPIVESYVDRWRRMPVLFDFGHDNQAQFMNARRALWEFTPAPTDWPGEAPDQVVRVSFSHFVGSALVLMEPYPDWSGHDAFYFDIFHPGAGTLEFGLRIDDKHFSRRWSDRFGRHVFLEPGYNRVTIPLDDVLNGPFDRQLDLERMARIVLYPVEPAGGYELYFGPVGLVSTP